MVSNQNDDMKLLADNLWDYFKPKLYEYLGKEISYFRATVVENNNDGTLIVKRPFDNPFAVKCTEAMQTASVGDSVLVLIFGENAGTNGLVVGSSDARYLFVTGTDGNIYTHGANATDVVLECKNLLNYESYANTVYVIRGTAVWENNGVKLTATAEDCYTEWRGTYQFEVPVEVGKKYILSWEENTNASGLVVIFPNATTTGAVSINNANGKSITYTAASGVTFITFRFGVANSGTTIAYKNIMLRDASITDDSYVPYAMTNRQLTENTQDIADKIKSFYVVPFGVGSSYDSIRITFTDNGQKSMFLYGYTINNQTLGAISYYRGSDNLNFVTSIGAFNIQQKTDSVANSLIINTGRYGTGFLLVNAPCTVSNLNW